MKILGVEVSKKLSVLGVSAAAFLLQQNGVDVSEVSTQVQAIANDPMAYVPVEVKTTVNNLIYYISALYIAIQGAIDMIKEQRKGQSNEPERNLEAPTS